MTFSFRVPFVAGVLEGSETALAVGIPNCCTRTFVLERATALVDVARTRRGTSFGVADGSAGWLTAGRPDSVTDLRRNHKMDGEPLGGSAKGSDAVVLTPEGILSADSVRPSAALRAAMGNSLRLRLKDRCSSTDFAEEPKETGTTVHSLWMLKIGVATVDKRKLVPFGEFIPAGFRWLLLIS